MDGILYILYLQYGFCVYHMRCYNLLCHLFYKIFKLTIVVVVVVDVIILVILRLSWWQWQKTKDSNQTQWIQRGISRAEVHAYNDDDGNNSMLQRRIGYLEKLRSIEIPQFEHFLFKRPALTMAHDEKQRKNARAQSLISL